MKMSADELLGLSVPFKIYIYVLAFLFGAAMGSFLNCAAWRIARGESFVRGRSRCPGCGHTLGAPDLVPVFSWLFLRGRCRWCGEKIAVRYFLTECAFGLLTVLCVFRFGLTPLLARNWVFICCLFCLSLVDLSIMEIPDGCLILSALAWAIAASFLWQGWVDLGLHVAAGLVFGGGVLALSLLMDKLLGRESMGGGDIKLIAVSGLYLGFWGTLFMLVLACILGLAPVLVCRNSQGRPFPFGPALSAASAVMLLWGDSFSAWYLGLFS